MVDKICRWYPKSNKFRYCRCDIRIMIGQRLIQHLPRAQMSVLKNILERMQRVLAFKRDSIRPTCVGTSAQGTMCSRGRLRPSSAARVEASAASSTIGAGIASIRARLPTLQHHHEVRHLDSCSHAMTASPMIQGAALRKSLTSPL